jgi:hypothetical protein
MSLWVVAITFASLAAAQLAIREIRRRLGVDARVAALGDLDYSKPHESKVVVAGQVPFDTVPELHALAAELGGQVVDQRPAEEALIDPSTH